MFFVSVCVFMCAYLHMVYVTHTEAPRKEGKQRRVMKMVVIWLTLYGFLGAWQFIITLLCGENKTQARVKGHCFHHNSQETEIWWTPGVCWAFAIKLLFLRSQMYFNAQDIRASTIVRTNIITIEPVFTNCMILTQIQGQKVPKSWSHLLGWGFLKHAITENNFKHNVKTEHGKSNDNLL